MNPASQCPATPLNAWPGLRLQPRQAVYHKIHYGGNTDSERRENALRKFSAWHKAEYMANLFVIAGVAVYLWHVANPPDPTSFVSTAKFRG
jgi:hypothetical protein